MSICPIHRRNLQGPGPMPRPALAPALLAGLLLPLVGTATAAWASDARRHGLAGNLGFEDDTDVHAFPQLAARHGDRLGLDIADQGNLLRGGVILGEATALGVFVHRPVTGDWFEPFDDGLALTHAFKRFGNALVADDLVSPTPLLELVLGFRSGFGLSLKLANSLEQSVLQVEEPAEPGEGEPAGEPRLVDAEQGAQSTTAVLTAGYSASRSDASYDLAGSLTFNRFKTVTSGKIRGESSLTPSFLLLARGTLRRSMTMRWVGLAQFYRRNHQIELPFHQNTADQRLLGLRAAVGPRIELIDSVTFVALGWLGFDTLGFALAKAVDEQSELYGHPRESSTTTYTLPGLDAGVEVQVTDWLALRGGWTARYTMIGTEATREGQREDPTTPLLKSTRRTALTHGWGAGVTLELDRVRLDGSITPGLLNDGPNAIGGMSPGTFAWVGLSYAWGAGAQPGAGEEVEDAPGAHRRPAADPAYGAPPAYPPGGGASPYFPEGGY